MSLSELSSCVVPLRYRLGGTLCEGLIACNFLVINWNLQQFSEHMRIPAFAA